MQTFLKDDDETEGMEKVRAAIDFFGQHPIIFSPIRDAEDLELYFMNPAEDWNKKDNVFRKICSLYNNRKTRRRTKKKQCNFSIDEKTINFIDTMAKNNRISRSELLERVFRTKNADGFSEMIQG